MRQSFAVLIVLTIVLVGGGTASGQSAFSRAIELERQGRFSAALAVLEAQDGLTPFRREHRRALRRAVRAFHAADELGAAGQHDEVVKVLSAIRADAVRDAHIVAARNARLQPLPRPSDRVARAHIRAGDRLSREGKHEAAADAYGPVGQLPAHTVSRSLREQAEIAQIDARADAEADDETLRERLGGAVGDVATTLTGWAAALAVVIALAVLLRMLLHRVPHGGTRVRLLDLGAGPEDRPARSSALTRDLIDEVNAVAAGPDHQAPDGLTTRRDLDGVSVPAMTVLNPAELEESLTEGETPTQVGPVVFSARQVADAMRSAFARPWRFEMSGTLRVEGERCALSVERTGRRERPRRWHAACTGKGSRAQVVRDVATQIAVDLGGVSLSSSWQSHRDYLEAMHQLDAVSANGDRVAILTSVAEKLKRSLGRDPLNVLARFQLASVQRLLGENRPAATNFAQVQRATVTAATGSPLVRDLMQRHPELFHLATYNRAVALAKTGDWNDTKHAQRMLAALVHRLGGERLPVLDETKAQDTDATVWPDAELPEARRRQLEVLSRAAWASTLVFGIDRGETGSHDRAGERLRQRRQKILEHLDATREWLDAERARASDDASRETAIEQAYATVENARGQALLTLGERHEAQRAFQQAIVLLPDFSDAYVNLAVALSRSRRGEDVGVAQEALTRALTISPRDVRARLLLGELHQRARRWAEAKAEFGKLPDDHRATFELGQVLAQEGQLEDAVEHYSRSLDQFSSRGNRANVFVRAVLTLVHRQAATRERVNEALKHARRLQHQGLSASLRACGARYVDELTHARAALR